MKLLLLALLAPGMFAAGFDLDSVRWQNRVVIIFAPAPHDERLAAQRTELKNDPCGVADRDLIIVAMRKSDSMAPVLRRRFGVAAGDFTVLLIGKDGTVKLRSDRPVSRGEIYHRIDGMPMRRAEMRASRSEGMPRCGEPEQPDRL